MTTEKTRWLSLDAARGFAMFWIIGADALILALRDASPSPFWRAFAAQMEHSAWHGLRFYDLIFPIFMFVAGLGAGLFTPSLDGVAQPERRARYARALRRFALLVALGIVYNHGWGTGMPLALDQIRYASVLGRIGFAWLVTTLLVWHCAWRTRALAAGLILAGYYLLQCWFPVPGVGAGVLTPEGSLNTYIDHHFLPGITYRHRPYDPEGLFSDLSAVFNCLSGALVARYLVARPERSAAMILIGIGGVGILAAWLWNLGYPINKELWTASFALASSAIACVLFGLVHGLSGLRAGRAALLPFVVIGSNALPIYLSTSLMDWSFVSRSLFGGMAARVEAPWQPVVIATGVLAIELVVLTWMYRRRLFLKI